MTDGAGSPAPPAGPARRFDPAIYLVTDAALCSPRRVTDVVGAAIAGGATTIQVREKAASARELLALLIDVARVAGGRASVLVDDRGDVFLAARALGAEVHGVHVGQSDLPPGATRALVGPDAIVGLSAATPEEIAAANALAPGTLDYLGIGAIYATSTKPDHPEPVGIEGFGRLAALTALPTVAIGGLQARDAAGLRAAGAAGLAVVSAICAADDPRAATEEIAREWGR